jgi:hypothetical protein
VYIADFIASLAPESPLRFRSNGELIQKELSKGYMLEMNLVEQQGDVEATAEAHSSVFDFSSTLITRPLFLSLQS